MFAKNISRGMFALFQITRVKTQYMAHSLGHLYPISAPKFYTHNSELARSCNMAESAPASAASASADAPPLPAAASAAPTTAGSHSHKYYISYPTPVT